MLIVGSVTLMIVTNQVNKFGPLCYVMPFVWGLQDSCCNILIRSLLGFEFESQITPFSVFNFVQSLFVFVVQMIQDKITD